MLAQMRRFFHLTFPVWLVAALVVGSSRRTLPAREVAATPRQSPPSDTPPATAPATLAALPDTETWISGTWGKPLVQLLDENRQREGDAYKGEFSLVVNKSDHWLIVLVDGQPVKGYLVATGKRTEGAKRIRGDHRTPEGDYYLWGRNPQSHYHKAIGVSYPNAADAERGRQAGLIDDATYQAIRDAAAAGAAPPQNTPLGGDIYIHGGGIGNVYTDDEGQKQADGSDWTAGCIALRDEDIDELFAWVPDGTPVHIQP